MREKVSILIAIISHDKEFFALLDTAAAATPLLQQFNSSPRNIMKANDDNFMKNSVREREEWREITLDKRSFIIAKIMSICNCMFHAAQHRK